MPKNNQNAIEEKANTIFKEHTYSFVLNQWLSLFRKTKNPIYAWRTYQSARGFGVPVPDEILTYLDKAAHDIVKIANDPPKANIRPLTIAKALGLGKSGPGADSIFNDYKDRINDKEIAIQAYEEIQQSGKEYISFEEVADKYKTSASSVRRIYNEHMKTWKEIAADFIKHKIIIFKKSGRAELAIPLPGNSLKLREYAAILEVAEKTKKSPT